MAGGFGGENRPARFLIFLLRNTLEKATGDAYLPSGLLLEMLRKNLRDPYIHSLWVCIPTHLQTLVVVMTEPAVRRVDTKCSDADWSNASPERPLAADRPLAVRLRLHDACINCALCRMPTLSSPGSRSSIRDESFDRDRTGERHGAVLNQVNKGWRC